MREGEREEGNERVRREGQINRKRRSRCVRAGVAEQVCLDSVK